VRAGRAGLAFIAVLALLLWSATQAWAQDSLRIGGKRFTEAYILVEVLAQTARATGTAVQVQPGLGNTAIVFAALQAGSIDLYPEYTGTIAQEILKRPELRTLAELQAALAPLGLGVAVPLGFHNGYALAMREDRAAALGIGQLSDLAAQPALRLGLSNEFLGRADGWPGLAQRYGLPQRPQGLDHGLAYEALGRTGQPAQVDAIDIYTTDAKISRLGLRVLADDASHFPRYEAVLLYRLDLPQRFPAAWAALQQLEGRIDEAQMIALNARAELDGLGFEQIAREHLAGRPAAGSAGAADASTASTFWARLLGPDLLRLTLQHLGLVLGSVGAAVALGLPLATWAAPHPRARGLLLAATGVLQTVPALALLAVLISLLGRIGTAPALIALTAYALLPVMRNTCTGLAGVPPGLQQAAQALGLSAWQRLRHVELPLALPVIVAGVRTATSIAVGTATIAAFIGAGGYGERIVTGLALNDRHLLLAGALPAAALALLFEALFAGWAAWRLRARVA
jgi:osmoprotectant transport system permease protein